MSCTACTEKCRKQSLTWAENGCHDCGPCSVLLLCTRTAAWHAGTSAKICAGEGEPHEAGHTSTHVRVELSVQPFHIGKKTVHQN